MSEVWIGRSGFTEEMSIEARAIILDDRVSIMTHDDENLEDGIRVMNFQKAEVLSLATWILDNVTEGD